MKPGDFCSLKVDAFTRNVGSSEGKLTGVLYANSIFLVINVTDAQLSGGYKDHMRICILTPNLTFGWIIASVNEIETIS